MTLPLDDVDLRYHADADVRAGLEDFSVNVRVARPPGWLRAELAGSLDRLGSYPDPRAALAAVAHRHGRPVDEVLLTAGAAETFTLLARSHRPRRAVCVHPSFTEPEYALRAAGHPVVRVVLDPPYALDPAMVPPDADLVVLGNPTNPTGVGHPAAAVRALLRPGRLVVVDEAFADTVPGEPDSATGWAGTPGLLVVRSLTKTWGLAGLRVGYALGCASTVRRLAAAQPLWPVSSPALVALEACSRPAALAAARRAAEETARARAVLLHGLHALPGVQVAAPSVTSFVLLHLPGVDRVRERLAEAGVLVRRGDTFPGLGPSHVRVAVRGEAATGRLLAALAGVLEDGR